jgi:hypothetical protein
VADGRLDASRVVTMKDLRDSGAVHKNVKVGVKLLATVGPALSSLMFAWVGRA